MLQNYLADSIRLFKNHYFGIAMIILPIFIPIEIFDAYYSKYVLVEGAEMVAYLPPMLVGLLAYPIYTAAVIFYIASVLTGDIIDVKTSWQFGVKYWKPLILLTIMVGFMIMLGFILLVVPAIILTIRYAFAEFELLFNKRDPLEAMRTSWEATRQYFWILLGGFVVITIVLYSPYYLLVIMLEQREMALGLLENFLNVIYAVLSVIYTIFAFRIYHVAQDQQQTKLDAKPDNGEV